MFLRFKIWLLLMAGFVMVNGQGIKNSHHDFVGKRWNGVNGCAPCHLPDKIDTLLSAALWSSNSKKSFDSAFVANGEDIYYGQPNGKSKLCMSCHDGTVAIARHVTTNLSKEDTLPARYFKGLMDEHPISVYYNAKKGNKVRLHEPGFPSNLGNNVATDLLENGYMECTSCHDIHLFRNTEGCTGCHKENPTRIVPLSLWVSIDNGQLCLTCHNN